MKRVLLLITGLERGGAEVQVLNLARSLAARGWDVGVMAFRPGPLEGELHAAGIDVRVVNPAALPFHLARLRPAIVHAHLFHANALARLTRLLYPAGVVISTVHSIAETSRKSGAIRTRDNVYRATDALADATVFVCEAAAERHISAHAASRRRARVLPNGVDTTLFHPNAALRAQARAALGLGVEFVWLAAGRLMWKKNYPLLLDAMSRQRVGVLLIAGEGPDSGRLRELAGSNVRFLGARQDMPTLLNASDAFVLSSDAEGLPMVLLEAAASGLPQVATDAGGVREAVIHGETGFVVARGDAAALASAMDGVASMSGEQRASMARAARDHAVAFFDLNAVTSRWEALYRELLDTAYTREMEP